MDDDVTLELGVMYDWIATELECGRPVAESMTRIIDKCELGRPHPDWARLRALPYADLSPLSAWLPRPFREEPPGRPLKGLWFGLHNPWRDSMTVADMYVCGAVRFEPELDDNSWAVHPDWCPETGQAESEVLADIYRIAYDESQDDGIHPTYLANDAEYPLCLAYASFAVRELLSQVEPYLLLGESPSLGIAVGFDSGDFLLIGELIRDGLRPFDLRAMQEVQLASACQDLHSSERRTVEPAIYRLRSLGDRARVAVPELLQLLERPELRVAIVPTLAAIAPDDARVRTASLQMLKDNDPYLRRMALQALARVQGLSDSDLAEIKQMQNDADPDVARWSEIALCNIALRNQPK